MRDRSLDEFLTTAASDDDADGATDADPTGDADAGDAAADADAGDAAADADATEDVEATTNAANGASGRRNPDGEAADTRDVASTDAASTGDVASPATPTMRFTPDGVCPACGASSSRLWNDGDRFVCAGCKEF